MYYAEIAEKFYNSACPSHAINGYEKNVLMDVTSEKCIFVSGDVQPSENEALFRCKRAHGDTVVTLKTPRPDKRCTTNAASSGTGTRKRFEGEVHNTIVNQDETEQFVFLPSELATEIIRTLKISNMDEYLDATAFGGLSEGYLNPYEILQRLHYEAIEDTHYEHPYPLLEYAISNVLYTEEGNPYTPIEKRKFHRFKFSHYERMNHGVCAVFNYEGVSEKIPVFQEDYEY